MVALAAEIAPTLTTLAPKLAPTLVSGRRCPIRWCSMFGCRLARGRGLRLTGRRYARRAAFRRQRSGSAWRSRPQHGYRAGRAGRYPVFSARDRRRIAFGLESTHRPGGIDDAWYKSADAAGVVILDTEAVDRDGKRGWIVVPAAAAKAIRKATK